jgi:hypothetical protein
MRIACVFVACALASSSAAVAARAVPHDDEFAVEVTQASLVLVPVFVNGRGPYRLVIDTGATTTMLDAAVAEEAGLHASGMLQIVTAAGEFAAPTAIVDVLAVGGTTFLRMPVTWSPLRELRSVDRRIAGVLGQDVLAHQAFGLDYRRGTAELTNACPSGDTRVEFEWAEGRPLLRVGLRAPGLRPDARLVLDSAANALILFGRAAHISAASEVTQVSTHQSSVRGDVRSRVELNVGGLQVSGPAVIVPDHASRQETGLLPASWFSRVCIDGPRRTATRTR